MENPERPKRSAFRDFIAALRNRWRTEFPFVRRPTARAGTLPIASTFYAGVAKPSGLHVLLWFQHSPKAWQVGQFTINVILAKDQRAPQDSGFPDPCGLIVQGEEGSYRIGHVLVGKDKWWHLKDDEPSALGPELMEEWRPTSYADSTGVIQEAIADVTRDARLVFRLLGLVDPPAVET